MGQNPSKCTTILNGGLASRTYPRKNNTGTGYNKKLNEVHLSLKIKKARGKNNFNLKMKMRILSWLVILI
jgi:hypothetical protein